MFFLAVKLFLPAGNEDVAKWKFVSQRNSSLVPVLIQPHLGLGYLSSDPIYSGGRVCSRRSRHESNIRLLYSGAVEYFLLNLTRHINFGLIFSPQVTRNRVLIFFLLGLFTVSLYVNSQNLNSWVCSYVVSFSVFHQNK